MNLNSIIKGIKSTGVLAGKEMNPKEFEKSTMFGPGDVCTYFNNTSLDVIARSVIIEEYKEKSASELLIPIATATETTDLNYISEVTRMNLTNVGVISATVVSYNSVDDLKTIIIKTSKGIITPMYFPRIDSNVAVYTNTKGELSYVIDGRVGIKDGKLHWISTNQEALEAYITDRLNNENVSFAKILSSKQWKIEEMEEAQSKGKSIIKAITWIGSCKYIAFPQFNDSFPINVIWGGTLEFNWEEVLEKYPETKQQIRVSSLAQNGINASCGKYLPNGEIGQAKSFFGKKAKFDISANQLVKNFRKAKKHSRRCLVVLAEIIAPNDCQPINGLGNALASKPAYDEYKSILTEDKAKSAHIDSPAHKIFVQAGDKEVVRVKGATSFIDITATVNGTTEDKVVVLPPREYNTKGQLETKLEPFVMLASFRDNELLEVEIEVDFNGVKVTQTVPALYCEIYEDAYHSAVYSLKIKPQNIFYYGALGEIYSNNGWSKMATAISISLNNKKLANAMNFIKVQKIALQEVTLDELVKR